MEKLTNIKTIKQIYFRMSFENPGQRLAISTSNGYKFAIPLTNIDTYYKLPITECLISSDIILVKIKIPLIQDKGEWELFEFVPLPFSGTTRHVSCFTSQPC